MSLYDTKDDAGGSTSRPGLNRHRQLKSSQLSLSQKSGLALDMGQVYV